MSENIVQTLSPLKVGRRSFLKMAALAGAMGASSAVASEGVVRSATTQELKEAHPGSKKVKTICTACSVGCGIIAEVKNDVWVRQEVAQDHPVSLGGHCSKGSGMIDMIRSQKRVKYPMKKENGKWKRISWDQAIDEISAKMLEVRSKHGPDAVQFFGSAKVSNEQAYYIRKFAAFFGTNNIDHQARLCHSSTVTGVANIFGYGAMTNHLGDIQKAKSIFIMGSNPAVGHPVGFQHFLKAKEINGAKLIVVEPRFTRTAAKADHFLQIRAGTDIAFMHGMINLIVKNGWEDKKYIEDRTMGVAEVLKESAKYTPEVVADICGIKPEQLIEVTRLYAQNRPGSFVWAMGLTQHSVGTGNTRIAPILQLILGNMGKSGGGCNILRGHDNVQGASDMGCLSENLPGYFPNAEPSFKHWANVWQVDFEWLKARFAPDMMFKNGFTLARWWQGVLQEEKIYNGDSGQLKVLFNIGTGLISISQTNEVKRALDKIDLFVMIDPFPHDAIAYSDKPDGIYLLPACSQYETSGTVTATNRSGQWRYQVVNPIYESKPDHEILFAFAKKFGFYNEYVRALGDGKGNFVWPEDATREIAKGVKTIGLSGWLPERLKAHTDNWHMFDELTLEGKGPMKGEYYGLPWPCWSDKHPGTPNLYDNSLPVMKGGMGFRNNWGVEIEYNGTKYNLLASEGSVPPGSTQKGGYPAITAANIEALAGITLTEEEKAKVAGKAWHTDLSMILVNKALEAGLCPYGNARARMVVWGWADEVPKHREPLHTIRPDLLDRYPTYKDKPNHFRVDTKYESIQSKKDYTKEFPLNLITGRLVTHNGQGLESRVSPALSEINPEVFVNINPNTALRLGVKDGEMVWAHAPEGTKGLFKVIYSYSVDEKSVFIPFHWAGIHQGKDLSKNYPEGLVPYAIGESANTVTNYGYDIMTQIPETKIGLCRIEKA